MEAREQRVTSSTGDATVSNQAVVTLDRRPTVTADTQMNMSGAVNELPHMYFGGNVIADGSKVRMAAGGNRGEDVHVSLSRSKGTSSGCHCVSPTEMTISVTSI